MRNLLVLAFGCGGAVTEAPPPASTEPGPEVTVSLRLLEAEPTADEIPRTDAWLALIQREGRMVEPVGTLQGVCHHIAPEQSVLQVRCWWAGAGALLKVEREHDELVVYRIDIDEMTGEGQPEVIHRATLPARAQLRPITPPAH